MAVIDAFAGNILSLTGDCGTNIKALTVQSTINLGQTNVNNLQSQKLNNTLTLRHTVRMTYGRRSESVASFLNLNHATQPKSIPVSASNYLALQHVARHPSFNSPVGVLNLSHVAIGQRVRAGRDTLNLVQNIVLVHVKNSPLNNSLSLSHSVAPYIRKRSYYLTSTPIPTSPPNYVQFILGSNILQLPRPEQGNALKYDFTRVNRRSRGGDLILFRDEKWPKTKTLTLTFAWLSETLRNNLLRFMQTTIGVQIEYHDHYGHIWDGFIMTPAAQIIQESVNNRTLSLDFQGVRR